MIAAISIDKHVGARIKARRNEMNLSPVDLADKLGVSEPQMFRYESGSSPVKPKLMEKLAKILRVDITYFLEGL